MRKDEQAKLAIVGIFFDGYYDLWEDFLELFETKWSDCPYPLYIVNNEKDLDFAKEYDVNVLHAGKDAEYSRKVQTALNLIEADYYLLLLEDFFFEKELELNVLDEILLAMQSSGIEYYRMQIPEFGTAQKNTVLSDKKFQFMKCISIDSEYTVTCQPSIWKREFLTECIGQENYNAWIFEGIYCYSQKAHTREFLDKCRVDYRNILGLRHGAVQGKMLPDVYNDFLANGYTFRTHREILRKDRYTKHLLKQKLKQLVPLYLQRFIKKRFKTKSVVEKYNEEIRSVMDRMNIY